MMVNPMSAPPLLRLQEAMNFLINSWIKHLKAYGAKTFVHIPLETRPLCGKFNVCTQKGYLVGYVDAINYRIWLPMTNTIIKSTFVKFDETSSYSDKSIATPLLMGESDSLEENP